MVMSYRQTFQSGGQMISFRVLLVEDQTIVRQALHLLLETDPRIRVVGEADSVSRAVDAARELLPDVILLDIQLGSESGFDAARTILVERPETRLLALTSHISYEMIQEAAGAGITGYAPKTIGISALCEAIETVAKGDNYMDPSLSRVLIDGMRRQVAPALQTAKSPLTEEERQLIGLIAEGLSLSEVGSRVYLTERTIRRHMQVVMDKLEVTGHIQAVALALRNKWI
jgi:DNA-binding NarL/FixJ family response regulator